MSKLILLKSEREIRRKMHRTILFYYLLKSTWPSQNEIKSAFYEGILWKFPFMIPITAMTWTFHILQEIQPCGFPFDLFFGEISVFFSKIWVFLVPKRKNQSEDLLSATALTGTFDSNHGTGMDFPYFARNSIF